MQSLLDLGHVEDLETAAALFGACIQKRNFFEPEAYAAWCRRILVDHPVKRALILPPGAYLDGDFWLDDGAADTGGASIGTIVALGDLSINGQIVSESHDSGLFLLAGGNLQTHGLIKGAASIVVLGSLASRGPYSATTAQVHWSQAAALRRRCLYPTITRSSWVAHLPV